MSRTAWIDEWPWFALIYLALFLLGTGFGMALQETFHPSGDGPAQFGGGFHIRIETKGNRDD